MAGKKKATPGIKTKTPSSGKKLLEGDPSLSDQERAVMHAVREFEIAEKTVELFDEENADVMRTRRILMEERNQKLQAADKAVRGLDVSCGPWDRYSESTSYQPELLYQLLGRDQFLEVGGAVMTAKVYEVDRARLEIAIKTGTIIKPEMLDTFRKVTPSYHTPKPKS